MASYFDPKNELADRNLLPPNVRGHSELETVAALAEADVIAHYTRAPGYLNFTAKEAQLQDGIVSTEVVGEDVTNPTPGAGAVVPQLRVYLRGFKADASHANVDPNLKLALRRTIAEVTRWRLHQWNREQGLSGSSDTVGKSRTYMANAHDPFPPGWQRWLVPFESDEPLWGF